MHYFGADFFCKYPKKSHYGLKMARNYSVNVAKCHTFFWLANKKRGISSKYHA